MKSQIETGPAGIETAELRNDGTRVRIERLSAAYDRREVLNGVTLTIEPGELVTLLGPSGCGKTTLLRVVAGLLSPTTGEIFFNEKRMTAIPAERRRAAMVFQKPHLFPFLNVAENVAFGLKMRRLPKSEVDERVSGALQLVQLGGYGRRNPRELSGGQEQRVALARALVTEPDLLLLDEPFSALDENLRADIRRLVRELQQRLRITTLFVTHDQTEASLMADRIALLLDGRLLQVDRPRRFYEAPVSPEVARFFGWQILAREGETIAIRPERIRLSQPRQGPNNEAKEAIATGWTGLLVAIDDLGPRIRYTVQLDDGTRIETEEDLPANTLTATGLTPGTRVTLDFPPEALCRFPSADRL